MKNIQTWFFILYVEIDLKFYSYFGAVWKHIFLQQQRLALLFTVIVLR